jgi:hypothetical protein
VSALPSVGTMVTESNWDARDGSVVALDLNTGARRWDLAEHYPASHPLLTAGDTALVAARPGPDRTSLEGVVVDTRTGEPITDLAEFDTDGFSCASDNRELIACSITPTTRNTLVTFRVGDRSVRTAPREMDGVYAMAVQSGRVTVMDIGEYTYGTVD